MNIIFNSNKEEMTIVIGVETLSAQKIRLVVRNLYKKHTTYTNRYATIKGKGVFYVRMPQSPDKVMISIYNEKNGNQKRGDDKTFRITKLDVQCLKRNFKVSEIQNPKARRFTQFAQEFAERAGELSANRSIYLSNEGEFRVDYLDIIRDRETGKVLHTPARISQSTGIIEISKTHFLKYTVPMRMAILLHEFSHFYLNRNMKDEVEADLNALMIYLGLGYPRIEAHQAFLEVFKGSPSDLNVRRHKIITQYINNFEKFNYKLCA